GDGTGTRPAHHEAAEDARASEPVSLGTQLAHTGTQQIGVAAGTGAALVLGGAILYRRARPARR
ncbi:LPXTG cell wall anchor domain-containing protein, partial [Streptomyces sp. NPDC000151]|uniref:LPXTG cell wall anchor domain-containing protein n=1 Tax=Streptomyces sp. NPDC000151 TaxID=3154244 RepID=UPI00331D451A